MFSRSSGSGGLGAGNVFLSFPLAMREHSQYNIFAALGGELAVPYTCNPL